MVGVVVVISKLISFELVLFYAVLKHLYKGNDQNYVSNSTEFAICACAILSYNNDVPLRYLYSSDSPKERINHLNRPLLTLKEMRGNHFRRENWKYARSKLYRLSRNSKYT